MEKPALVLGIDPGTTTAYAVLNTKGKLLRKKSSKTLNQSSLISEVIKLGKIVVVGSDKKNTPKFVGDVAKKLGARVVAPKEDLAVKEKKNLTKDFNTKDSHELDALASAIFSYKEIRPLLRKIESFVRKYRKEEFEDKLKKLVLTTDINIKGALKLIEAEPKQRIKIVEKIVERKITDKDFLKLYEKVKRLEKENLLLRKQNKKLRDEMKKDRERYSYLKKKIEQLAPDEKAEELLNQREERIVSMQREINMKDEEINGLQDKVNNLIAFISKISEKVLIKKLRNLGWIEFSNKKILLNIKKDDILMIDDLGSYSEKALKQLENTDIIISNNSNKEVEKKLTVVKKKDLKFVETEHFALADAKAIENIRKKIGILDKVIKEYKEERK